MVVAIGLIYILQRLRDQMSILDVIYGFMIPVVFDMSMIVDVRSHQWK